MAASLAGSTRCARPRRSTRSSSGSSGWENSIHALLVRYGLFALLIGAGFEGETVVIAGGIAARHGLFPLAGAMAASSVGSFLADQLFFALGRYARERPFVARQRARPAFARVLRVLERHPIAFIFGFRFVYGIRTISPIAIGTSAVPGRTFLPVNAAAAVIWACTFTVVGYAFGRAVEHFLHKLQPSAAQLGIAAAVVAVLVVGVHLWRRRRTHGVDSAASLAEHRPGLDTSEGDA